jgi:hypothetical protein
VFSFGCLALGLVRNATDCTNDLGVWSLRKRLKDYVQIFGGKSDREIHASLSGMIGLRGD